MSKVELPENYRIIRTYIPSGDPADPYDWGEYTHRLDVWEARTVGHLWWKKVVRKWWSVECHDDPYILTQTAYMREKKR